MSSRVYTDSVLMLDRPEGGSPVTQVGGRNTPSRCFPIKAPDLTAVPALAAHYTLCSYTSLTSFLNWSKQIFHLTWVTETVLPITFYSGCEDPVQSDFALAAGTAYTSKICFSFK